MHKALISAIVGIMVIFVGAIALANIPQPVLSAKNLSSTANIAKHNTEEDCWTIIGENVYDITSYVNFHPGGKQEIIKSCGVNATELFKTKGGRGNDHMASTYDLLENFYIGAASELNSIDENIPAASLPENKITEIFKRYPNAGIFGYYIIIDDNGQQRIFKYNFQNKQNISLIEEEVAKHNTANDCWIIVNKKVYDVTNYIPFHPGGQQEILSRCGDDATIAFITQDGEGKHSDYAWKLLEGYLLGPVGDIIEIAGQEVGDIPLIDDTQSPSSLDENEVAKHNTEQNCWIIVNDKIYDVTNYIPFHPGGKNAIINECGGEATTAFETQGGEGSHSTNAQNLLDNYYIGDLNAITLPVCGDGIKESAEQCDDGNTKSGDGCSSTCKIEAICGNSKQEIGEECDDGNTVNGDGCSSSCALEAPQQQGTLDAQTVAQHSTEQDCWIIVNNKVYDVTNYIPFHPGGKNAIINECGGESTTAFETQGGGGSHSTNAHNLLNNYYIGDLNAVIICGNGIIDAGEQCDDGNTVNGDGCSSACIIEAQAAVCGNGIIEGTEQCDDGNTVSGDGCSSTCTTETQQVIDLTPQEVALHNIEQNCWIIVNNKVYDVTNYIPFHPGGKNAIINECGGEATTAFNTRGGTGSHSTNAQNLLSGYLLGDLNGQTTPPDPGGSTQPTSVEEAIEAAYPGAVITSINYEDDGRSEVKFRWNGHNYQAKLNANFVITEIE